MSDWPSPGIMKIEKESEDGRKKTGEQEKRVKCMYTGILREECLPHLLICLMGFLIHVGARRRSLNSFFIKEKKIKTRHKEKDVKKEVRYTKEKLKRREVCSVKTKRKKDC